jgi:hypothetical protein
MTSVSGTRRELDRFFQIHVNPIAIKLAIAETAHRIRDNRVDGAYVWLDRFGRILLHPFALS